MKKLISLVLACTIALSMVACGGSKSTEDTNNQTETDANSSSTGAEIALVTDVGTIDDKSFNQGSWEGVVKYAEEHNISHKYYKPAEKSNDAIITAIELAIKGGAKIVVCPGFLFEVPVYEMQKKYPDVKFIIIDGTPNSGGENPDVLVGDNTEAIYFAEEQAGFLAGYAAVKEGYKNLGFMGGLAVPAVIRFGYGYIQGAEYAGKELGFAPGDITMNYTYVGDFEASPEHTTKAAAWYNENIDVIFGCGGGVGNSVMNAAAPVDKKVIGVDVDQSSESPTVITSAMKNLQNAVYTTLDEIYNDNSKCGTIVKFDVTTGDVLLPMETSKFENFNQEQYDAIYKKLVDGEIEVKDDTAGQRPEDLGTEIVVVNFK